MTNQYCELLAKYASDYFKVIDSRCSDKKDALHVFDLFVSRFITGIGYGEEAFTADKFINPAESWDAYWYAVDLYYQTYHSHYGYDDEDE